MLEGRKTSSTYCPLCEFQCSFGLGPDCNNFDFDACCLVSLRPAFHTCSLHPLEHRNIALRRWAKIPNNLGASLGPWV